MYSISLHHYGIFIIICFISSAYCLEEMLMWRSIVEPKLRKETYFTDAGSQLLIDGSTNKQTIVKIVDRDLFKAKVIFYCTVEELKLGFYIQEASFCRKKSGEEKVCKNIDKSDTDMKFDDASKFQVYIDIRRGMNLTSDWDKMVSTDADLSGMFYCDFRNARGSLLSGALEIQDVAAPFKNFLNRPDTLPLLTKTLKTIVPNDLPLHLDCPGVKMPSITAEQRFHLKPTLLWEFCVITDPMSKQQCLGSIIDGNGKSLLSAFDHVDVLDNGTLVISGIKKLFLNNSALICFHKVKRSRPFGLYHGGPHPNDADSSEYLTPITINGLLPYTETFHAVSPLAQTITLRAGQRSSHYKLSADYKGEPELIKSIWTLNGKPLSGNLFTLYHGSIGPEIKPSDAGEYKLEVTHQNGQKIEFTWQVIVKYPPRFEKTIEPEDYVVEGENWEMKIAIDNDDDTTIQVNGYDYETTKNKNIVKKDILEMLKLGKMKPIIQPQPLNSREDLIYKIEKVKLDETHIVTVLGENNYGFFRATKRMRVVPKPVFISSLLDSLKCADNCSVDDSHLFTMEISKENRENILKHSVQIQYKWKIGNVSIEKTNKFFDFKNDDMILEVRPLNDKENPESEKNIRSLFENGTISCEVTLHSPLYSLNDEAGVLYRYNNSSAINIRYIPLPPPQETIGEAGFQWWWIIIILIILLLILLFILIYICCCKDKKRQTYDVDGKERETGREPEKDLEKEEIFPEYKNGTYEDEPILKATLLPGQKLAPPKGGSRGGGGGGGSQRSLTDDCESIDLDPNAYNEDGSFIMKYRPDFQQRTALQQPL